jgi:chromosome segregation ATPase
MVKPNNKQTNGPAATTAFAEGVVSELQQKHADCVKRGDALLDERKSIALSAHTGNTESRKRLDDINVAIATHDSELQSLNAALSEAAARLAAARQVEAREADREQAKQLRQQLAGFTAAAKALDGALEIIVAASNDMREHISEMNRLGQSHPSHSQLDSLGALALRTALTQTGWQRYFERVAPNERKSFAGLAAVWAATVERSIAQRLGEQTTHEAA